MEDLKKEVEKNENGEVKVQELDVIRQDDDLISFDELNESKSRQIIKSTITDPKTLFNLDEHIDCKLNDMENKELNMVDVVIKVYEKEIPERLNEYTGELETVERKIVTIIVDDTNTSYVTGSKMFGMRMIKLLQIYKPEQIKEGLKIKITKTTHKNTGNKKLGFEIV